MQVVVFIVEEVRRSLEKNRHLRKSKYNRLYEEALDSSLVQQLSDGKREAVNRELRECAEEMKDLELYDGDTPSSSHVPSPCSGLSLQNNKGGGSHTR